MNIVRPANPQRAIDTALKISALQAAGDITAEQAGERFSRMLTEQPYSFLGVFVLPNLIADVTGKIIGELQPGDSFTEV